MTPANLPECSKRRVRCSCKRIPATILFLYNEKLLYCKDLLVLCGKTSNRAYCRLNIVQSMPCYHTSVAIQLTFARGFVSFSGFGAVSISVNVSVVPNLDDLKTNAKCHVLSSQPNDVACSYGTHLKISLGPVIRLAFAMFFFFVSSFKTNIAAISQIQPQEVRTHCPLLNQKITR